MADFQQLIYQSGAQGLDDLQTMSQKFNNNFIEVDRRVIRGNGSPEGSVSGSWNLIYIDNNENGSVWVKKSLSGSTGWKKFILEDDVNTQILAKFPAGKIDYFARKTAPDGWVIANGLPYSTSLQPRLTEAIYCGDTENAFAPFGYKCTNASNPAGSRSTTGTLIVVPNLIGVGIRGWDEAGRYDITSFNVTITAGIATITVPYTEFMYVGMGVSYGAGFTGTVTVSQIQNDTTVLLSQAPSINGVVQLNFWGRRFGTYEPDAVGRHMHYINPSGSNMVVLSSNTADRYIRLDSGTDAGVTNWVDYYGNIETRGKNVALLPCISL